MFISSSYIGNYSVTVPRIKPRERPWLYKPCVTSPEETCQRGNETERDGCPLHIPLSTSLQYQLMIHMLPVTQWERYCNTPSASPSPDPHRHPSERQAAELKAAAVEREEAKIFQSEPTPPEDV